MVATDFVTNKKLRCQYINKVDVLNKIENIELLTPLPSTEYVTMNQVADFYQVPLDTIKKCYHRHEDEICSDGVILLTSKMFKEQSRGADYKQFHTHIVVHVNDNVDVVIPNRGIAAFSHKTSLRFGMLLKASDVAKQVREYLFSTEECATTVKDITLSDEADLFVKCVYSEGEERLRACYTFSKYKDSQIAQKDIEIAMLKDKLQTLQKENCLRRYLMGDDVE